jgi:hypothetical protein
MKMAWTTERGWCVDEARVQADNVRGYGGERHQQKMWRVNREGKV